MKRIILLLILILAHKVVKAQNDSIYFWKNNVMIHKQSIKTADLDSITFRRPAQVAVNMPSATICNQLWTTQNLDVSTYSDGTPIPQVTDPTQWASLTTGAWCYYNNDPVNGGVYGKLYNWYAVAGIHDATSAANPALRKKLAPTGWHIPSDGEWSSLINCLDPNADGGNSFPNIAGGKMKATGTIQAGTGLWQHSNFGATNETGFTGLPGGGCFFSDASFFNISGVGYWWSATEGSSSNAWIRHLDSISASVYRNSLNKNYGFSVRCLRD
jgi:uncharacterized protein (TIGR02145 family)